MVSPNKQLEAAFLSLSSAPGLADSDAATLNKVYRVYMDDPSKALYQYRAPNGSQ